MDEHGRTPVVPVRSCRAVPVPFPVTLCGVTRVILVCLCLLALFTTSHADELDDAFADLEALERLDALGYAGGYVPAPAETGVLLHDPSRTQPGVNLVLSSHRLGASVLDADGKLIHEWAFDPWVDIPLEKIPSFAFRARRKGWNYWSRAEPLADGGLLFIQKGCGVFRIDRASRLVWAKWLPAHHDLQIQPDGRIFVLARTEQQGNTTPDDDFIVTLSATGEEQGRISIVHAILNSACAPLLQCYGGNRPYLHTNKIHVLDGRWADRAPAFKKGNILLSCRDIDTILVIDPKAVRVEWTLSGMWRRQHDPRPLANGNLLIFDNRGNKGYSRILEINPFTREIAWIYEGTPPSSFNSQVGGVCARLANGNTLITASTQGRAFEVTPDKTVVWEYVNPHRNGEHIAPLFEVRRIPQWPPPRVVPVHRSSG